MTERTVIPAQPDSYTDADFEMATRRVQEARERLLKADAARRAHDALATAIDERVARRQASLAQLRKAVGLTQAQVAATLGIDQAEVSKVERRPNLKLATLERFIEATGGSLRITAVYGDVEVQLSLGELLAEEALADEAQPLRVTATTESAPRKASPRRANASTKSQPKSVSGETSTKRAATTDSPKRGRSANTRRAPSTGTSH